MAATKDLVIQQGKTFSLVLRWEAPPIIYKAISAIQQTAPVRLTVVGHGIPDGWRGAVTGVKGMTDINAEANNVRDRDYNQITVVDTDTIEINAINAANFKAYESGGHIQFNTPVNITGFTARMSIKDKVGGTELASSDDIIDITLDTAKHTVTLNISAADTAAIAWAKGVYELELESSSAVVTQLLTGKVSIKTEVAT